MTSIARAQLDGAVRDGIVSAEQAEKLVAYLGTKGVSQEQARFTFVHGSITWAA
jgi:hypothetical protein